MAAFDRPLPRSGVPQPSEIVQQLMAELRHGENIDQVEEQLLQGHTRMAVVAMPQQGMVRHGFARRRVGLAFYVCDRRQTTIPAAAAGTAKTSFAT